MRLPVITLLTACFIAFVQNAALQAPACGAPTMDSCCTTANHTSCRQTSHACCQSSPGATKQPAGAGAPDGSKLQLPQTAAPFARLPADYVEHWRRNLRDPEYCRMVLCNGKCADRGTHEHSACSLHPLFPILGGSAAADGGCSKR